MPKLSDLVSDLEQDHARMIATLERCATFVGDCISMWDGADEREARDKARSLWLEIDAILDPERKEARRVPAAVKSELSR